MSELGLFFFRERILVNPAKVQDSPGSDSDSHADPRPWRATDPVVLPQVPTRSCPRSQSVLR
jgi:hypothetical protein